jgi:hypothetical protein
MANHNGRASSTGTPKWLLPMNKKRQTNRVDRALFTASTSTQTSGSNHGHIQTQRRPSVPQHEPEPSATAHQIISTTPPSVLASDNSVACAAKRKAPDVAPRDEGRQDCHPSHVTTNLKGGGDVRADEIWISEDEGTNIRMKTTMARKDPRRRVTLSGYESHSKRARMVTNHSDDGVFSRLPLPPIVVPMIFRGRYRDPTYLVKKSWRSAATGRTIRAL